MKRKKRKLKKWVWVVVIILFFVIIGLGFIVFFKSDNIKKIDSKGNLIGQISSHYSSYVKTNKEAVLYNNRNEEVGRIGKDVEVSLEKIDIDKDTKKFQIKDFDEEYYIAYEDVDKIDSLTIVDSRYQNYIVFNENIVTSEKTNFYDKEGNLVYQFNKSFDLPIYIMDSMQYGVEFQGKILYVKDEDVALKKENNNTDKKNASGVGVLNYHAFYDETNEAEKADCTTVICHSKAQFKTHLDYFKENNIFTLTMDELEMYIDGKLQLPKSVLITIDDGPKTKVAVDMLTEYKMNATIFLVTSWFNVDEYYKTEYIELHSHTHNLHDGGQCPGGQGSGLKCLPEETILEDLKASREALNGSTALCYPFYEYNDYTIRLAKEAGFTMGFIGESNSSDNLVHVSDDKFRLRRFVIVTYTTLNDIDEYFSKIKV